MMILHNNSNNSSSNDDFMMMFIGNLKTLRKTVVATKRIKRRTTATTRWVSVPSLLSSLLLIYMTTPFIIITNAFLAVYPINPVSLSISKRRNIRMRMTPLQSMNNDDDHMNQYNIVDMDEIVKEWAAIITPASPLQDEGIYLYPKTKEKLIADTVKITFVRKTNDTPLGLNLLEIAGGRDDGVGITMIQDIYDYGCSYQSGILPGDSIIQIDKRIINKNNKSTTKTLFQQEEKVDMISVSTECLGYDKTIDAIRSVMNYNCNDENKNDDYEEIWTLTCKRLRRRPKVTLKLQYPDNDTETITLELFAGENLRRALLVRGVKLNDPLAKRFDSGGSGDCGAEGSCATCAVSIIRGYELLNPPNRIEKQVFIKKNQWRMSCKTIVGYGMNEGEIVIRVNPKQWDT